MQVNKPQMSIREALTALELTEEATLGDVRHQYRRLAMVWHPDKNASTSAATRMVRINLAWECVLKLFQDCVGSADREFDDIKVVAAFATVHLNSVGASSNPFDFSGSSSPWRSAHQERQDPFWQGQQFYGGTVPGKRGRNIKRKLKLTLFEAAFGTVRELEGEVQDLCTTCGGDGRSSRHGRQCTACRGAGAIRADRSYSQRWSSANVECPTCRGHGQIFESCKACEGNGLGAMRKWKTVIKTPPGARTGDVLVQFGMGGKSSSPDLQGELHCSIEVLPHDYLHLNEDGVLEVNALVSIWRWIAGGEVVVPLLDGSRVVRFPSMAHEVYVKGEGWPTPEGKGVRGDLLVQMMPLPLGELTQEQRQAVDKLASEDMHPFLKQWDQAMQAWTHGTQATRFPEKPPRKKKAPGMP